MASGSGIGATVSWGAESTWGTAVTPTRFPEVDSETLNLDITYLQGYGLRGGGLFPRGSRRTQSRRSVSGAIVMELPTKGFGLLIKHVLGSALTVPTVITGTAYKQVHTVGSSDTFGLTVQVGRPQTDTTVVPFTFSGMKITDFELSVTDGQLATCTITFDGKDQTTATTLTAYTPIVGTGVFGFANATVVKVGGTASTTSGVVSIASGTSVVSIIKGFTLKLTRGAATERYGLGNGGTKAEQIINAWETATVTLDSEFTSHAEFYDRYTTNGQFPFQVTLVGNPIAATGSNDTFDMIFPQLAIDSAPVNANGPDILGMSVSASILDDGANTPIQFTIISTDATL